MQDEEYDVIAKVIIVGNMGTGKSSLLNRFSDNSFGLSYISTIGVDFKIRSLLVDTKRVKLQIWDTAGQERFRAITHSYYHSADGVFIVYDVTDVKSFQAVRSWLEDVHQFGKNTAISALIGNKADLVDKRTVSTEQGQALADELGLAFFEASALNGQNVEKMFQQLATILVQRQAPRAASAPGGTVVPGRSARVLHNSLCCS
eukprot:TRINITY_DN7241_c0_g1_i2.p1 TRINITY_DN7241_c0_g1~~TRINITY_DN7241_c0_g1_i2.p1  ORF type:complete len:203 (-),score=36.65 TRINITY_DN7241_c0_g1_i2:34-642(-)